MQKRGPIEHAADHGVHAVSPHLTVRGAAAAIDFYRRALGATEMMRIPVPDGTVMHACLSINGSSVMLADEMPGQCLEPAGDGARVSIHLVVEDADASVARMSEAGATVIVPVEEQFWGDRFGMVADPFGHRWSFGTPVRTMTREELLTAARAAVASAGR